MSVNEPPPIPVPRADKKLGQHYLNDKKIIQKICFDFDQDCKSILEIGPGPGILTETLAEHKRPFNVIEKDKRFLDNLKQFLSGDQILFTDALEVDLVDFLHSQGHHEDVWLVSNLPYNISAPLIIRFLQVPTLKYMTLMMQKEVGEKIFNWSGKSRPKQMSSLMALCQQYYDISLNTHVPPGAFSPPPKVDSVVLSFVRKEHPSIDLSYFATYESFLKKLFAQRRKQIGNNIKGHFDRDRFEEGLNQLGRKITDRSEVLTVEEMAKLFHFVVLDPYKERI